MTTSNFEKFVFVEEQFFLFTYILLFSQNRNTRFKIFHSSFFFWFITKYEVTKKRVLVLLKWTSLCLYKIVTYIFLNLLVIFHIERKMSHETRGTYSYQFVDNDIVHLVVLYNLMSSLLSIWQRKENRVRKVDDR